MARKVDTHYDSSEIQVLEGLEPVPTNADFIIL